MSVWVVIPVKGPATAKTRLSGILAAPERARLFEAMLGHVAAVAASTEHVERVCILGSSRFGLPEQFALLPDPGTGLNPALQAALPLIEGSRMVVLHADLPILTRRDVELLALAPPGAVAMAPDRHGTGTNALSLPLPDARGFTFAFGPDSFALHKAEAARLGLPIEEIHSPGLARDIDEPEDLPDAAGLNGATEMGESKR